MLKILTSRSIILVIGISLVCMLAILRAGEFRELMQLRERTLDFFQRLKPREAGIDSKVIIADIDEQSLEKLGQWPWPRNILGDLIEALADYEVKVIGFDAIFPEYDRSSAVEVIGIYGAELNPEVQSALRQLPRTEERMIAAMQKVPVVMGVIGNNSNTVVNSDAELPYPSSIGSWFRPNPIGDLTRFRSLKGSLDIIQSQAAGHGVFSLILEEATYRKTPLVFGIGSESIFPSLVTEMLRVGSKAGSININNRGGEIQSIAIPGTESSYNIATDSASEVRIYFSPPQPYNQKQQLTGPYVPAYRILEKSVAKEKLAGKYVLVGSSASGLKDLRASPLSPSLPGVEIHTNLLQNILDNEYLIESPNISIYEFTVVLLAGIIVVLLTLLLNPLLSVVIGLGMIAVNLYTGWVLFDTRAIIYDPGYSSMAILISYTITASLRFIREGVEKTFIRNAFQHYLSPDLVIQLTRSRQKLELGGQSKDMSILFCDVRNFTNISESYKNNPAELTFLLNRLMTPLSNAITTYKGTIDKYMGDCVMAFWNAPIDLPDHADYSVMAALTMQQELAKFNQQTAAGNSEDTGTNNAVSNPKIEIGIGINSGTAIVGNMGSDIRFDYSVIGDPVNLASRLEGQSKNYFVNIIIGEETYNRINKEKFYCLELDRIFVQGKSEAITIYTVLGYNENFTQTIRSKVTSIQVAFLQAYRSRNWPLAQRIIIQALTNDSFTRMNGYYRMMQQRLKQYQQQEPATSWQGVYATYKS